MTTSTTTAIVAILISCILIGVLSATWKNNSEVSLENRQHKITIKNFQEDRIALDQLIAGLTEELREYKRYQEFWVAMYGETEWNFVKKLMEGAK